MTEQAIDAHYKQLVIQPFLYSKLNKLDPQQHTIIKYVTRCHLKGQPLRDLKAARKVLDQMIEELEGGDPYGLRKLAKLDEYAREAQIR